MILRLKTRESRSPPGLQIASLSSQRNNPDDTHPKAPSATRRGFLAFSVQKKDPKNLGKRRRKRSRQIPPDGSPACPFHRPARGLGPRTRRARRVRPAVPEPLHARLTQRRRAAPWHLHGPSRRDLHPTENEARSSANRSRSQASVPRYDRKNTTTAKLEAKPPIPDTTPNRSQNGSGSIQPLGPSPRGGTSDLPSVRSR